MPPSPPSVAQAAALRRARELAIELAHLTATIRAALREEGPRESAGAEIVASRLSPRETAEPAEPADAAETAEPASGLSPAEPASRPSSREPAEPASRPSPREPAEPVSVPSPPEETGLAAGELGAALAAAARPRARRRPRELFGR